MSEPRPGAGGGTPRGRILCVTSTLPRWAGDSTPSFVLHLAQDLQAQGWQVDLLAPHAAGAATAETMSGVRVERFRYFWPATRQTVCYGGGALVNLRKWPLRALQLPFLVAAELAAVLWRLQRRRYDLVHSHWILPQGLVGTLACALLRRPHVITVHGSDIFALRGAALAWLKRLALRGAAAITVNSAPTEGAVRALLGPAGLVTRAPLGVAVADDDPARAERARALRAAWRRGRGPVLLFVGRLIAEKGPEDLLEAVRALRDELDATAVLVGDGQDRAALAARAEGLGIAARVVFAGWMEPVAIPDCMAAADACIVPSRRGPGGSVEGQGLVALEAMAAGTPVIATRIGGLAESIRHEHTGLLVDERAPADIAAAVRRLAREPELARRLAQQAAAEVRAHGSREAAARRFGELFDRLLATRPVRR